MLSSLAHLWLYENFLTGSVPEELELLVKFGDLQLLVLDRNQLTG